MALGPRGGIKGAKDARKVKLDVGIARIRADAPPRDLHTPRKDALVELELTLEALVGLTPVKDFINRTIDDGLRFHAAGTPFRIRHIILSRPLGSGKRLAANLIAKTFYALGLTGDGIVEFK